MHGQCDARPYGYLLLCSRRASPPVGDKLPAVQLSYMSRWVQAGCGGATAKGRRRINNVPSRVALIRPRDRQTDARSHQWQPLVNTVSLQNSMAANDARRQSKCIREENEIISWRVKGVDQNFPSIFTRESTALTKLPPPVFHRAMSRGGGNVKGKRIKHREGE